MDKIREILSDIFKMNTAEITDELTMKDVERWDSLTHMKLVVTLEETYNITLDAEQIMAMKNVKAIKEIIFKKAAA